MSRGPPGPAHEQPDALLSTLLWLKVAFGPLACPSTPASSAIGRRGLQSVDAARGCAEAPACAQRAGCEVECSTSKSCLTQLHPSTREQLSSRVACSRSGSHSFFFLLFTPPRAARPGGAAEAAMKPSSDAPAQGGAHDPASQGPQCWPRYSSSCRNRNRRPECARNRRRAGVWARMAAAAAAAAVWLPAGAAVQHC